uniref:CASP-like protein 1 n=1 Tax=Erigeron canadensis TaxID=72917 RepID=UPI001CB8E8AA|nr:CASP-like protein 1 [Erigeron canadensis]
MASIGTTVPPHATMASGEYKGTSSLLGSGRVADVALRVLLFATALVAIIVMVTSEQTKLVSLLPGLEVPLVAKFNYSPALIYLVAALSVACLYSLITGVLSVLALMKLGGNFTQMHFYFVILDSLLLGIVAAATGAAGSVGYIALKGNSHTGWNKICDKFTTTCVHYAASIILSFISSIALLLLVWLSVCMLSKIIARR